MSAYAESMESYLAHGLFDLISPDGKIEKIIHRTDQSLNLIVHIDNISPAFVGFSLDTHQIFFNLKSTLAQLDLTSTLQELFLDPKEKIAKIQLQLSAIGKLGSKLLPFIEEGCYIGKLFAADPRRKVRNPDYLLRMFGRTDRVGDPLLSLGGSQGQNELSLERVEGYLVALLKLQKGVLHYDKTVEGLLPTIGRALKDNTFKTRNLLSLHQIWKENEERIPTDEHVLLVKTTPLHIRTAFARVIDPLLPKGLHHTSADVLQPDTKASGDVYELFGRAEEEITHIPLEFYTLEPHREHVFFSDRDQLQSSLEDPKAIFRAFETAPKAKEERCSVFIVKGQQMANLTEKDWIHRIVHPEQFPGLFDLPRQSQMVQDYIQNQPSYPFLKAIENGLITSQGVLFSRYFPSPLMKKMLLGDLVQSSLKGIYFEKPSQKHGEFFSHEDRTTLLDLAKFAIPVYWADRTCGKILQYAPKPEKDTGMFVPIDEVEHFTLATSFGVYGSHMLDIPFEEELSQILEGILEMKKTSRHKFLNPDTPLALITGGGPGVMETSNQVAKKLGILSCGNIVDFSGLEQDVNPYIDAKMTYRLDRLVERQGEFNLDFPIFLTGGIGTDFEFALENVRRKVKIGDITPSLLLGDPNYWKAKLTTCFQANRQSGTIAGFEWVSNCFYCVQNASQALKIYEQYFSGKLPIGPGGPIFEEGFVPPGRG